MPCSAAPGVYDREKIEKEIFPCLVENEKGEYFSPSVWAKAFRRELYVNAQSSVPDDIKIGEDNACTKPIIARAQKLAVLPDCTYVYRCAVHYLFNAVASQYFSGDDKAAKENIKNALSDEYYLKAVKACRFKAFSKGALALFALKHKAFRLIKAYSKTR